VAVEALVAEDPAALTTALKRIREGVPLWNFFLVIVLALAVFEIYLANRARPTSVAAAEGAAPEQEPAAAPPPEPELVSRP
jgi:hypothetical protein